jgi:F-type H+-transporting ATPase subunit b
VPKIPQLEVSTYASQIFWLVLCLSALYVFLSRYYLPRVRKILGRRASHLATQEQDAHGAEVLRDKVAAEHAAAIEGAKARASANIRAAVTSAGATQLEGRKAAARERLERIAAAESSVSTGVKAQESVINSQVADLARAIYYAAVGYHPDASDEEMIEVIARVRGNGGA